MNQVERGRRVAERDFPAVFEPVAANGRPSGRAAPSSGTNCTSIAPSSSWSVSQPVTGSINVGRLPHSSHSVCRSFHFVPVFSIRDRPSAAASS